jgi:hypothetical protein
MGNKLIEFDGKFIFIGRHAFPGSISVFAGNTIERGVIFHSIEIPGMEGQLMISGDLRRIKKTRPIAIVPSGRANIYISVHASYFSLARRQFESVWNLEGGGTRF